MLAALAQGTLVVLISFPGLPHFGIKRHKPAPQDTLPPVWKSSSRLTLEDRFVRRSLLPLTHRRVALKVQTGMDPRHFVVDVDPDSGTITSGTRLGDVPVAPEATGSLGEYSRQTTRETFQEVWRQNAIRNLNSLGAQTPSGAPRSGLSLQFPSPLPPRIQSLLGPGGPALNVSGSENISLSGTSTWTNQQTTLLGQGRSLFPSLDMQQNLDIRLEGQLSDRIKVNLLQNSANQIPLANRIAINYRGSEDDLVQQFDLGNTNLSLPGTQYVSYSGRNEGLFGLKSALRYGPLDVTMLASKQEGRSERSSYAGGASKQIQSIRDLEYVQGVYFMLYDPNGPTRIIDYNSLEVYKDDNVYANLANKVRGRAFLEPAQTLAASPDSVTADTSVAGWFKLLQRDADYDLMNDLRDDDHRYIRLRAQVTGEQALAVTYDFRFASDPPGTVRREGVPSASLTVPDSSDHWLKLIRTPATLLARDTTGQNFDLNYVRSPLNATRELEMRNIYNLGGTNIDPRTFVLNIRRGFDDPPDRNYSDPTVGPIPYIELVGLDSRTQADSLSAPLVGPDGRVDQAPIHPHIRAFLDYTTGTLMFPDLRPFFPRLDPAHPFEAAIDSPAFVVRRAKLNGPVGSDNAPNLDIYEKYIVRQDMAQYFLDVEFTAQRATGEIYLGRSNIVDGSETVTINGVALHRDKDYTIDYDLGRIKLIRQLGPSDNLNIDYSYAPLFQQAGRTLLGGAFQLAGRERGLGGAFLYESRGAQDLRPRLGEEPSRSLIADLNSTWSFKPQWMTHLADRLPGVRTTAPSDFNVQAEAGQSFPNPNTRNEVFVDDMEGARDAVSLSFDPSHWRLSSVPLRKVGVRNVPLTDNDPNVVHMANAELHWFSPPAGFQERDLKPNLADGQGAQNYHQTLCLSIPKLPDPALGSRYAFGDSLWAGLTYVLDQAGLDLSRSQFIELWVNDWRDRHDGLSEVPRVRGQHVKLHIDLGTVSEDEMLAPNKLPNGVFDSEDLNHDGVLQVTGDEPEDLGTDGKDNAQETDDWDMATRTAQDRHGDDFVTISDTDTRRALDSRRYLGTNGTEGNHTLFPIPDTEDLNGNQQLDKDPASSNNYIEYTIDLGDTAHLITDVYRDYPAFANNNAPIPADNGWRRYRIPLSDTLRTIFGNPNLVFTKQVRLWIEGMADGDSPTPDPNNQVRPLLVIGGLDIVGSRWLLSDLTARGDSAGSTATLNTVNTVDNADIYYAPFDPGKTREGNQEVQRREQSIALEFNDLIPSDTLEAYRTFSVDEDYSRYKALDWWVTGYFPDTGTPPLPGQLEYFVRFASDENGQSYYEYRAPVPIGTRGNIPWQEVHVQLTDLSNLKLDPRFPKLDPIFWEVVDSSSGVHRIVKGRPSFTRLRRISFGVRSSDNAPVLRHGQVWLDEIRATDIARDVGRAGRFYANGHVANLISYNTTFDYRDADFLTVGQTRGSGSATRALTLGATMDVHRFFEGTGIILPVSFSGSWNDLSPRFNAGDDVVRTGAYEQASRTFNQSRTFATQYSRTWGDRSNPFLRYTIGGITASYNQSNGLGRTPSARQVYDAKGWAVGYGISPRRLLVLGVPRTKFKLYPLPERMYWNYSIGISHSQAWQRTVVSQDTVLNSLISDIRTRTAGIDFGLDSRPLDFLHHHIDGHRNLVLPEAIGGQSILGLHVGRVTSWSQGADARFSLNRGAWLNPTFSWLSNYSQNNGPELSSDLSVRSISNGQTMTMNWEIPLDRLGRRRANATPGVIPSGNPYNPQGAPGGPYPRPGQSMGTPPGTQPTGLPPPGTPMPGTPPQGTVPGTQPGTTPETPGAEAQPQPQPTPPGAQAPGTPPSSLPPVNPLTGPPAPSDEPTPGIVGDSTRVPSGEPVPGGAPSPEISAAPRPGPADSIARVLPDTSGGRRDTLGVRPGVAAVDTAGRVPPPPRRPRFQFDLGSLIAHIGSIGTDASFTQSSSYSRVTGTPDFFYLLGLKPNPSGYGDGERVSPVAGNTRSASRDLRTGARTRVTLPFGMSLTTRADFQSRANETNGLASRTLTFHYPYIDVEYGTITKIIRLERFLQRPVLKTTLDHNLTHGYAPGSSRKTSITESTELRPLLSLSGELKNQTRVDMRIDTRNTTNENRLLGSSTDFDRTVEGKLDLSRQYTQGQKVQFLGKESTVRSSISLGASAVYSRLSRGTIVNGNQIQPYKESRLSVSGTGSYGFSDNVYGNASIGFSQTRNLVSAIVTRSLRVELRAQFSF